MVDQWVLKAHRVTLKWQVNAFGEVKDWENIISICSEDGIEAACIDVSFRYHHSMVLAGQGRRSPNR